MLSGISNKTTSLEQELSKSSEQLQCIFNVLGLPSEYIIFY